MSAFNWDVLKEMLDSDFWKLGGTSDFFSGAEAAQEWAHEYVILPYGGISEEEKQQLLEYSDEALWYAMTARGLGYLALTDEEFKLYGYTVDPYEAAHIYWNKMAEWLEKNSTDPWLIKFFGGQVEISKETVEYVERGLVDWDEFKDLFKTDTKKYLWIAAALAFLYWRK